jgi:exonuclease SbcC
LALRDVGVADVEPYSAQVAGELERARQLAADHEKTLSMVDKLQSDIKESSAKTAVAEALAGHLRANGFEQWLMSGALGDLVGGANGLLSDLSSGGYSLNSDDAGSFSIVDHFNADEMRSVSTLSGGETFLVSLALALSLAETLSAAGGARLDTIILDEGFGTLDTESLDIVASVLEELAGDGLMVGVITHVKELASRASTRFEVKREPTGSVVERVS